MPITEPQRAERVRRGPGRPRKQQPAPVTDEDQLAQAAPAVDLFPSDAVPDACK